MKREFNERSKPIRGDHEVTEFVSFIETIEGRDVISFAFAEIGPLILNFPKARLLASSVLGVTSSFSVFSRNGYFLNFLNFIFLSIIFYSLIFFRGIVVSRYIAERTVFTAFVYLLTN